jgi:hypothetical protein
VALFLFAFFLFLVSTVFPFLLEHRTTTWVFAHDDISYWSFKSSTQHLVLGEPMFPTVESWFYDYWTEIDRYQTGLAAILVSMFLVQILTLITSLAYAFSKKRLLAVAPTILASIVIALMTYVNNSLSHPWSNSIDVGYVLEFPSLLVWLLVAILSYAWKKEEAKDITLSARTRTLTLPSAHDPQGSRKAPLRQCQGLG